MLQKLEENDQTAGRNTDIYLLLVLSVATSQCLAIPSTQWHRLSEVFELAQLKTPYANPIFTENDDEYNLSFADVIQGFLVSCRTYGL